MTVTLQQAPSWCLPAETVFDNDPTYGPGWRGCDPDGVGPIFTLGHVTADEFTSRIQSDPDDTQLRIDPDTIRHGWVLFSRHTVDCIRDMRWTREHVESCPAVEGVGVCPESRDRECYYVFPGDDPADVPYDCDCHNHTWVEDRDGMHVHLIDATADTPGAVPITWGSYEIPDGVPYVGDYLIEVTR
jgi:hypothetical protein